MAVLDTPSDVLSQGRAALARGVWDEARACFEPGAQAGDPEALEGLGWAAWWLSDEPVVFGARQAAYRAWLARRRPVDAARVATWLGTDSVDFRGDVAVGQGWLSRARGLLRDAPPGPELGWLHIHEAEKLIFGGRSREARDLAAAARDVGARLGLVDLTMMAASTEGLALVLEGEGRDGMPLLAEAATAAVADEFAEPWAAGWSCCYLIYACEQLHDLDGAAQWCRTIEQWCDRWQIRFLNRTCRAHYASVLTWRGSWAEAESQLTIPSAELPRLRRPAVTEVTVRLGELRRRQGRTQEAEALFREAEDHPLAILGCGEVLLDTGDGRGARERAEQYLRLASSDLACPRTSGLSLLARASAALGDAVTADASLAELSRLATAQGADPVLGSAAYARGAVASAAGDDDRARVAFEDAIRHYHRAGAPFEESLARLALARLLRAADRTADAVRHGETAHRTLAELGAARAAQAAQDLLHELGHGGPATSGALTVREREVLALVAEGLTNRGVARALTLSEHTVNRHVTNILTKLAASSRSAAVAEALRRGLI